MLKELISTMKIKDPMLKQKDLLLTLFYLFEKRMVLNLLVIDFQQDEKTKVINRNSTGGKY